MNTPSQPTQPKILAALVAIVALKEQYDTAHTRANMLEGDAIRLEDEAEVAHDALDDLEDGGADVSDIDEQRNAARTAERDAADKNEEATRARTEATRAHERFVKALTSSRFHIGDIEYHVVTLGDTEFEVVNSGGASKRCESAASALAFLQKIEA